MENNALNNTTNNIKEDNKMRLVMRNGEIKEVDTSFMFDNQYNITEGKRVYDTDIDHIENDIRLGEFYCSSVKQGTYEEVQQAIDEERSKIHKCSDCWWFHERTRVKDECEKETIRVDNKEITRSKTVYEISCAHKPKYDGKCVHDIEEKPRLFREVNDCFFCKYPNGIPSLKPLRKFMIDNAEKYGVIPYWGNEKLSEDTTITYKKLFGSYKFESSNWSDYFELFNNRNKFKFYVDFENRKFILGEGIGYEVVDFLGTDEWNRKTQKSQYVPIKNYDKFAKWFWQIVSDFLAEQNKKEVK